MKHPFNKSILCLALLVAFSSSAYSSIVRNDVDYLEFRNFAENRGRFQPNTVNIPIYNKQGQFLGNMFPRDVPMPDFSAVEKNLHITTLIHPQYVASVKHNSDKRFWPEIKGGLTFGMDYVGANRLEKDEIKPFKYQVVARNDHPHTNHDFNTPRLNKMVTEVAPSHLPQNLTFNDFRNDRFEALARVGTGRQYTLNEPDSTKLSNSYIYPIGGSPVELGIAGDYEKDNIQTGYHMIGQTHKTLLNHLKNLDGKNVSPLINYITPGDSGSPLFGYDRNLKRWVLVGFGGRSTNITHPEKYGSNLFALFEKGFVEKIQNNNLGVILNTFPSSTAPIYWRYISADVSELYSGSRSAKLNTIKGNDLNNGKDLVVRSIFNSNINNKVILHLKDSINQGAGGLYFLTSAKVQGEINDTFWIGSGIYTDKNTQVEWQIKNPHNDRISKLGPGELLVNGIGVNEGSISVGDGKVTLAQRADARGRKQAFKEVQLASGRGTVSIADADQLKSTKISFGYRGGKLDLNNNNLTLDRIAHWDDGAIITNLGNKYISLTIANDNIQYFQGNIGHKNGSHLSLEYLPKSKTGLLAISGNVDLKGYVHTTNNGQLIFTGAPVEYAGLYENKPTINDYNWKNRKIKADSSFYARKDSVIEFGRNIASVHGNFQGNQNGTFIVGFINNVSRNCENGNSCTAVTLSNEVINQLPRTKVFSNATLTQNAKIILGKAHLQGKIDGKDQSLVNLKEGAIWTLTQNSTLNNLVLENGSKVLLNPDNEFKRFNTLTIRNMLSGNGYFRFSTNLAELGHNKLILNGNVEGRHTIAIMDSGVEPKLETLRHGLQGIRLIQMNRSNPNATFNLEDAYIDAGAYRYVLDRNFRLNRTDKPSNALPKKSLRIEEESVPVEYNIEEVAIKETESFKLNSSAETFSKTVYVEDDTIETDSTDIALSDDISNTEDDTPNITEEKGLENENTEAEIIENKLDDNPDIASSNDISDNENDTPYTDDTEIADDNSDVPTDIKPNTTSLSTEKDSNITPVVNTEPAKLNNVETSNQPESSNIDAIRVTGNQAEIMSHYANNAVYHFATIQRLSSQSFEQLTQHSINSHAENGAWIKLQKNHIQANSNDYRGGKFNTTLTQIGAEFNHNRFTSGIAYTENRLDKQYNIKSAGGYAKYQWDNGLFSIADIQFGRAKNPQYHQKLSRLGITTGWDAKIGDTTITPYIGSSITRISKVNYNNDGANIYIPRQNLITYHTGLKVAQNIDFGTFKMKPFIGVHYLTSNQKQTIDVNNAKFTQKFDHRLTYQGGIELNLNRFGLTLGLGTTKGKELKRDNQANIKVNFSW